MYLHQAELLKAMITPEIIDTIEQEVDILDDKIDHQQYVYVITRDPYYRQLEQEMSVMNRDATNAINHIKNLEKGIMRVSFDESKMRKALKQCIDRGITLDSQEYYIRENKLYHVNIQSETFKMVEELGNQFYASVLDSFTGDEVSILGG